MSVPRFSDFFHPLLRVLAAHPDGLRARDAADLCAKELGLSEAQRAEMLPSGRSRRYRNRAAWAQKHLKEADLTCSPTYGVWQITDSGRKLLEEHPVGFDPVLNREIEVVWRSAHTPKPKTPSVTVDEGEESSDGASPIEQIEDAVTSVKAATAAELLDRLADVSPDFFEQVVLDVLEAMGYGAAGGTVLRTGGTADGGIDGVITLDKLGLQRVGVQAKRWKGSVGSKVVQEFYGALVQRRAQHGVIITTSAYTKNALSFAEKVSEKMVLVDGAMLVRLMVDHGVGVSARTYRVPQIDQDYFEEG